MKNRIVLLLCILSFLACKKQKPQSKELPTEKTIVHKDSAINKEIIPIDIYCVLSAGIKHKPSNEFLTLNKNLAESFNDYSKINKRHEFQDRLKTQKENSFTKILARDLKNPDFNKVETIYASFVKNKIGNQKSLIEVEEWIFKNERYAISCMNRLEKRKDYTI